MAKIIVRSGVLGEAEVARFKVPSGFTCRRLLSELEHHIDPNSTVRVAVDGRTLTDRDLDDPFGDDALVAVVPPTTAGVDVVGIVIYALTMTAISFAVSYAMQQLAPRPKQPGEAQDRGDDRSPTYAWDGIQTSYGQGFPVPIVYGRHAVGGQVIFTDVLATSDQNPAAPAPLPNPTRDVLTLILALSEGPIAAVGDTEARELNGLGGVSGGVPGDPLPAGIEINGLELQSEATSVDLVNVTLLGWGSNVGAGGGQPTWQSGYVLNLLLRTTGAIVGHLQVVRIRNALRTDLDLLQIDGPFPEPALHLLREDPSNAIIHAAFLNSSSLVTRVNENPGAVAWIRPGTLDQSALPADPFRGSATAFSPGQQLDDLGSAATYAHAVDQLLATCSFVLSAPSGSYQQDNQGNLIPFPIVLELAWRFEGGSTWNVFWDPATGFPINQIVFGEQVRVGPVLETFTGAFGRGASARGPVEVRVVRRTAAAGTNGVSAIVWRNVVFTTEVELRYPRLALLGLQLASGARFSGGLPQVRVPISGVKVRVWDATAGFSPRTFDAFATGPWAFMSRPPGRNPAWIALDFLTSKFAVAPLLTRTIALAEDREIDLPAFRRWAAFCDTDPSPSLPWGEAGFCCDLVIDSPRTIMEWLTAIFAAGRASIVMRDGLISVSYQYRDAHSDAGISVAAKAPVQLFTSGNVEKVQVRWLQRQDRPTALLFQFLNEEDGWRQDVLPVPDAESTLDTVDARNRDQWLPQTIQAFGVTRPGQLWREGVFRHRVNRLVRRELTFETGRWSLACEVGDLIDFEHELLRPFGADVPMNMVVRQGGTAVTSVKVDHDLTGSTTPGQIVIRDPDGEPQRATFNSFVVSGGETTLTLNSAVTVEPGATCVVGKVDKLTETYQIIAISIGKDLKREVRALQWVPEVFDEVTRDEYLEGGTSTELRDSLATPQPRIGTADVLVTPLRNGWHRIAWSKPPAIKGATTRVYEREAARAAPWELIASTELSFCEFAHFLPGRTYEISIAFEDFEGEARQPDDGVLITFEAPEFPAELPPRVSNVRATAIDQAIVVEWDPIDTLDAIEFELRVGSDWNAARVVWRGRSSRAVVVPPPIGEPTMLVAVRSEGGLYGDPAGVAAPAWLPVGTVQAIEVDDFATSPGGTHDGTEFTSAGIRLAAGELTGVYTSATIDAGYQAPFYWSVEWASDVVGSDTVDDAGFGVASGEAHWRLVNDRAASPGRPGSDFELSVDDLDVAVDDTSSDLLVAGNRGEPGWYALVRCESRFFVNGAWSAWRTHEDRRVVSSKFEVRFRLDRESEFHDTAVVAAVYRAHI